MKVSYKTLDKVLFHLNSLPDHAHKCKPIRESLGMDKQTFDAVMAVLEADGFFGKVHRIEEEDGYFGVYFNEKGRAFAARSSYAKEYWNSMPKRYWWVAALFAILTFSIPLILQNCTRSDQQQTQVKQTVKPQPHPSKK